MNKKNIILIGVCVILIVFCLAVVYHLKGNDYNTEIKKIYIKYYPGYNIATAEGLNEINQNGNYIDEVRIELTGEDFKKAEKFFSNIKPTTYDCSLFNCVHMMDAYEVYLNDNIKISMGDEFGFTPEFTFDITPEFNEFMTNIINDYSNKNIYKTISSENVSFVLNGSTYKVEDKYEKETILGYKYFTVNNNEDYLTYDKGPRATIILDNMKIYLYGSIIGYIESDNINSFVYLVSPNKMDLYDFINTIDYNKEMNLKSLLDVNVIKIDYKNNTYEIKDKDKIEEITKELLYLKYSRPSYIFGMSEDTSFNSNDIKVIFDKSRYYIPGDKNWGSRFFVSDNDIMYDVLNLTSSKMEKYVKELINYNE